MSWKSNTVLEIQRRLAAGETVYVWWENWDNEGFGDAEWIANALMLVPNGDGTYERYWRREGNTAWRQGLPHDHRQNPATLNSEVHSEILADEAAAIRRVREWHAEYSVRNPGAETPKAAAGDAADTDGDAAAAPRRAFHRTAGMANAEHVLAGMPYVDEVMFGLYDEDGFTEGEMALRWERDGDGPLTATLSVTDESWELLATFQDVLAALAGRGGPSITPADFCRLLLDLGFADFTQRPPASA